MTVAQDAPRAAAPGEARSAPWWAGALAGLVAAGAGLAVAEVVSGIWISLRSPVLSVGDRVVDGVPPAVKDWAISTFGTADKAVLVGGVQLLLALAAAGIGVLALRHGLRWGLAGVAAFGAVGVAASLGRGGSGAAGIVPSLLAGAVSGAVLVLLVTLARRGWAPEHADPVDEPGPWTHSRRRFLGTTAAVAAGSVALASAGRWLRQQGTVVAERLRIVLPEPAEPLPPVPEGADLGVPGVGPYLTPNADFYRIDTALTVPQVDPADWTLAVTGMVGSELLLTYEELLDRPMVEADVTLACVSNEVGGSLVGNARWLGCRLDDLLEEAGIDPDADQVVGRSVDGFTAGFPTAVLDGRDALVAVGMNGEPLPVRHGFPARLVVPGLYGYVSATKWLSMIELTRFDLVQGYWIPRGWAAEAPIKTQARIDTPLRGKVLRVGEPAPIAGVAWAPTRGIERVEVQIDDGPWTEAELGEEHADTTWRQWVLDWVPTEARYHQLRVRATDGTGATQTADRAPAAPDGATGWHTFRVNVR